VFARFDNDPHAIVRWMGEARPRDFAVLAPLVLEHAACGDPAGRELVSAAAAHVDAIAERLVSYGAARLSLAGGIAAGVTPWLAPSTREHIVEAEGDALSGALRMARGEADALVLNT
jgi:glucosamine kinase